MVFSEGEGSGWLIKVKENNSIFLIINCSGEEGLGLDVEVYTEMIKAKQLNVLRRIFALRTL